MGYVTNMYPEASNLLRICSGRETTMTAFEQGECDAALVSEEWVQKKQSTGNFCGYYCSRAPVLPVAYGMPVSPRVSESISVAIKTTLGDWLDHQTSAMPVPTCAASEDSGLQPITPWHCSGILLVTVLFVFGSFAVEMWACRKRANERQAEGEEGAGEEGRGGETASVQLEMKAQRQYAGAADGAQGPYDAGRNEGLPLERTMLQEAIAMQEALQTHVQQYRTHLEKMQYGGAPSGGVPQTGVRVSLSPVPLHLPVEHAAAESAGDSPETLSETKVPSSGEVFSLYPPSGNSGDTI